MYTAPFIFRRHDQQVQHLIIIEIRQRFVRLDHVFCRIHTPGFDWLPTNDALWNLTRKRRGAAARPYAECLRARSSCPPLRRTEFNQISWKVWPLEEARRARSSERTNPELSLNRRVSVEGRSPRPPLLCYSRRLGSRHDRHRITMTRPFLAGLTAASVARLLVFKKLLGIFFWLTRIRAIVHDRSSAIGAASVTARLEISRLAPTRAGRLRSTAGSRPSGSLPRVVTRRDAERSRTPGAGRRRSAGRAQAVNSRLRGRATSGSTEGGSPKVVPHGSRPTRRRNGGKFACLQTLEISQNRKIRVGCGRPAILKVGRDGEGREGLEEDLPGGKDDVGGQHGCGRRSWFVWRRLRARPAREAPASRGRYDRRRRADRGRRASWRETSGRARNYVPAHSRGYDDTTPSTFSRGGAGRRGFSFGAVSPIEAISSWARANGRRGDPSIRIRSGRRPGRAHSHRDRRRGDGSSRSRGRTLAERGPAGLRIDRRAAGAGRHGAAGNGGG